MKKKSITLNEEQLMNIVAKSVKKILKEDYAGDNDMWNRAKEVLDCKVMLESIEYYLDKDNLLDKYAKRLAEDFDLS